MCDEGGAAEGPRGSAVLANAGVRGSGGLAARWRQRGDSREGESKEEGLDLWGS